MTDDYKIGAWYDSYNFDDQQYDNQGAPLASPLSNGIPAAHSPNYSIYGVMDKVIWLSKENTSRFISFFARPDVHDAAGSQPHRLQRQRRV